MDNLNEEEKRTKILELFDPLSAPVPVQDGASTPQAVTSPDLISFYSPQEGCVPPTHTPITKTVRPERLLPGVGDNSPVHHPPPDFLDLPNTSTQSGNTTASNSLDEPQIVLSSGGIVGATVHLFKPGSDDKAEVGIIFGAPSMNRRLKWSSGSEYNYPRNDAVRLTSKGIVVTVVADTAVVVVSKHPFAAYDEQASIDSPNTNFKKVDVVFDGLDKAYVFKDGSCLHLSIVHSKNVQAIKSTQQGEETLLEASKGVLDKLMQHFTTHLSTPLDEPDANGNEPDQKSLANMSTLLRKLIPLYTKSKYKLKVHLVRDITGDDICDDIMIRMTEEEKKGKLSSHMELS